MVEFWTVRVQFIMVHLLHTYSQQLSNGNRRAKGKEKGGRQYGDGVRTSVCIHLYIISVY